MSKFSLHFDWRPYAELDKFALMARQDRNLGNSDKWFNCFRSGLRGLKARLKGVEIHYNDVHEWGKVNINDSILIEYHLSSVFFNMDSALECFVFLLNSLGYAVEPASFVDISDQQKLKTIKIGNIIGLKNETLGYAKYFPYIKEYIMKNRDLLEIIIEQHDVSKHRMAIFTGGRCRFDPPEGFFKQRGIPENDENKVLYAPFAEIMLMNEPKLPDSNRKSIPYKDYKKLEDIGPRFCIFISELGYKAKNDAQMRITPLL